MCDKPLIVQASFIQPDPQLSGDYIENILHLIRKMQRVADIRAIFGIHKMKGYESRFVFGKTYMKPLPDQIDRVFSKLILLCVESFDLPQQGILKIDPLLVPLDREIDMVCQSYVNALIQLQLQSALRVGDDIIRDLSMFQRHIRQQLLELFRNTLTLDPENQQFSLATNLGPEAQVLLTDNTGILDAEFSNMFSPFVLGTIELPEDITIIPDSLFHYICGDIILDFKNCVNNIQSIGTNFALSSGETKVNIKNFDIANMINLQEIKSNAFKGANFLDPFKLDFRNLENKITISNNIFSSDEKNFLPIVGDVVFPKLIDNIPSNILVSSEPLTGDICFLSETVPTFSSD